MIKRLLLAFLFLTYSLPTEPVSQVVGSRTMGSLFLPTACQAQTESPYTDLTKEESTELLGKILGNPGIIERLDAEKKSQLAQSSSFKSAILQKHRDSISKRNIGETRLLKKVINSLYPPDAQILSDFNSLAAFGERLEYLVATKNTLSLFAMVKDESLDQREKEILNRKIEQFARATILEFVNSGSSTKALDVLSALPDMQWYSSGQELFMSVISGITKDNSRISTDQVISLLPRLKEVSENVPGSKQAVLNILEASCLAASDAKRVEETTKLMEQIKIFSGTKLRSSFAEQLLFERSGGVDKLTSEKLIAELKSNGELSLSYKLKLMFDGYFGPLVPILVGLSILFPLVGLTIFIIAMLRNKFARINFVILIMKAIKKIDRRKKKILPGYMRPIEVETRDNEDEYTRLLGLFGLADSASEAEIKKTYRQKMKELHPDRGDNLASSENSGDFRDLKHAYNRVLEIRAAWFSGRQR